MAMDQVLIKKLIEAGMSEAEARIYLTLLQNPSMSIKEVVRAIQLPRSTIVVALQKLSSTGAIDEYIQGKRRHFVIRDPKTISNYVTEEEKLLQLHRASLNNLVPSLGNMHFLKATKGINIETLSGEKGFKELYLRTLKLKKGDEILRISVESEKFVFFPDFLHKYSVDKSKKGIKTRLLIPESKLARISKKRDAEDLREKRLLPRNMYNPDASIVIWGEYASITIWDQNLESTIIKSKQLVDILRSMFELLWLNAKK